MRPYTIYSSKTDSSKETSDTRNFIILTDGYESDKNSFANISLSNTDEAHITFSNISILLDTKEVTYMPQNQTLLIKCLLSEGGVFTLHLAPYIVTEEGPNFTMQDKYDNVLPIFNSSSSDTTHIERFVLRTKMDSLKDVDQLKAKYQGVDRDHIRYKASSIIKTSNGMYYIGSVERNIIAVDKNTRYAYGGEADDIYLVNDPWPKNGVIDNQSKDKATDVLSITVNIKDIIIYNTTSILEGNNDLVFLYRPEQSLIVRNYFRGNEYKHLVVLDKSNESYIPFYTGNWSRFYCVPFYYAQIDKNDYVVPSDVERFVVEGQKENINFYKEQHSIVLYYVNNFILQNGTQINVELRVKIKDFYSSSRSVKIFLYNDGTINYRKPIELNTSKATDNNPTNLDVLLKLLETTYDTIVDPDASKTDNDSAHNLDKIDYNSMVDVQHVSFIKNTEIMFNHAIKNGIPVSNTEHRLGALVINDVHPEKIIVEQHSNNLTFKFSSTRKEVLYPMYKEDAFVVISNYFVNANYGPYMLHFNFKDRDPIIIHTFNNTVNGIEIKLLKASSIYEISTFLKNNTIEVRDLRCVYSLYDFTLKMNDMHKVLDFASLQDMQVFTDQCFVDGLQLSKLSNNTIAFECYYDILKRNIDLQNCNMNCKAELQEVLNTYFHPTNISNFIEQLITENTDDGISRPDIDSGTKVRRGRSVHFNDRDISEYNMQHDLDSTMQDSSIQMLSSASKPGSWFASVGQKIANFFKPVTTTVGQKFWGSGSEEFVSTNINTKSIDPVLLNDYKLIADSNTGNNAQTIPILEYIDVNGILCLGIIFCGKNPSLKNPYTSPQKAAEMQRNTVLQEVLQNLEQAMNRWDNNTYDENFFYN